MILAASISEFFALNALTATISLVFAFATPYVLASLGETFGQRSGVYNLGVDGVMLLGAFAGYYTVLKTKNVWLGCLVAIGVGLILGLFVGIVNVLGWAEQGISGIGFFLFGLGMSELLFEKWVKTPLPIRSFPKLKIPLLSNIPRIGEIFFQQHLLVYLTFAAVPLCAFILNRTRFGLNITAAGENPEAADSLGVSVPKIRMQAQLINGAFSGLAGAVLAINLGIFQQNLTNGLGFIAVALVYFGAWRPVGVMGGALLYGLVESSVLRLKALSIIPRAWSDIAAMTPAVVTIVVLVFVARRARQPSSLGVPFVRHG
jgi:general nucleoside transport system permease protein